MKKLIQFVLIISLAFIISACEKQSVDTSNTKSTNNTTTSIQTTTTTESKTIKRNYTFRNTVWGDSVDVVKSSEGEKLLGDDENGLTYEGDIMGYDCSIVYQFNKNRLYSGGYYINNIYSSAGQYISAYEAIKKELYKKYGDSTEDEIIKLETDSLIEMAGDSRALEYGYVAYRAKWSTKTTNIILGMMAENYDISIVLTYTDKNYEDTDSADGI